MRVEKCKFRKGVKVRDSKDKRINNKYFNSFYIVHGFYVFSKGIKNYVVNGRTGKAVSITKNIISEESIYLKYVESHNIYILNLYDIYNAENDELIGQNFVVFEYEFKENLILISRVNNGTILIDHDGKIVDKKVNGICYNFPQYLYKSDFYKFFEVYTLEIENEGLYFCIRSTLDKSFEYFNLKGFSVEVHPFEEHCGFEITRMLMENFGLISLVKNDRKDKHYYYDIIKKAVIGNEKMLNGFGKNNDDFISFYTNDNKYIFNPTTRNLIDLGNVEKIKYVDYDIILASDKEKSYVFKRNEYEKIEKVLTGKRYTKYFFDENTIISIDILGDDKKQISMYTQKNGTYTLADMFNSARSDVVDKLLKISNIEGESL